MKFNTFLCLPRLCSSWLDFFANSSHSPLLLVTHSESHLLSASSLDIPSTLLSHSLFTCCSLLKKAFPWLLFGELHLIPSLRLKCHLFREEILHKGSTCILWLTTLFAFFFVPSTMCDSSGATY